MNKTRLDKCRSQESSWNCDGWWSFALLFLSVPYLDIFPFTIGYQPDEGEGIRIKNQETWVLVQGLPPRGCMALRKSLSVSGFHCLQNNKIKMILKSISVHNILLSWFQLVHSNLLFKNKPLVRHWTKKNVIDSKTPLFWYQKYFLKSFW